MGSTYDLRCDLCGRFIKWRAPGSSWSQSWSYDMSGTPDLHDPVDRCAPCTEKHGIPETNCHRPHLYQGRYTEEGSDG